MQRYDVIIAGGGVIGSSIALELARAGLRVALFDAQEPGREASWASAGIISAAPEGPAANPVAPLARASAELYPDFIRTLQAETARDVGYRAKGTLQPILGDNAATEIASEIAMHHGYGLRAEAITAEQAWELEPALT